MAADSRTGRLTGCLPIRGVLHWADQACAELVLSADLKWPKDVRHREDSVLLMIADHPLVAPWQAA